MQPVHAVKSAPGFILGVGNVGPHLTSYRDGDTYLSRDGGQSWTEVRKGENMFAFGDYGGIIILVDDSGTTDRVEYVAIGADRRRHELHPATECCVSGVNRYSLDDGQTWQSYR